MELLFGLLALGIAACLLAGPVLLVVAWVRVNRRLDGLDALVKNELSRLQRRVRQLEKGAPVPVPDARASTPESPGRVEAPASRTVPEPKVPAPAPVPPAAARPTPRPLIEPLRPPSLPEVWPAPARARLGGVDWERWIGIRGAAVLGAVALALAGLLLFKYSIERGLITPAMRVVCGMIAGMGCLAGSRPLRRRGYGAAAEALSAGGIVILYAAFWAAHIRYDLIGMLPTFVLMALVTATCCLLALRESSFLVAVLGLVGGFATPLLLSSGMDHPIGLFGYVLLLNLGMLVVGHQRRWASLGLLSVVGTVMIQALWIGSQMGPDRIFLGLAILAVFAVLFVVAGRVTEGQASDPARIWSQAGAIFFPFAFAIYFAARVDLGERLYPIALLLALLAAAACLLARDPGTHALGSGAAVASVAVVGVWVLQHTPDTASAWELVGVALGLSLVFHLFVERDREEEGPALAAMLGAGGFFVILLFAATVATVPPPWPWLAGWAGLAGLAYRHAGFPRRSSLQVAGAAGLGVALSLLHQLDHFRSAFSDPGWLLALLVVAAIVLHAVARLRRGDPVGPDADHASATLPAILLVTLAFSPLLPELSVQQALGGTLALGVLVLIAATRRSNGAWYAAAVAGTALTQAAWTWQRPGLSGPMAAPTLALVLEFVTVAVFTGWLFLAPGSFRSERLARWAAALAGPVWFLSMKRLFETAFGDAAIGLLPLALGALSLAALVRTPGVWPSDHPERLGARVWFAAVALGFVSVAIPLQLEREWVTIAWALEGFAVMALWRRLDHAGLKYFGLALLGAVTIRLVANPALLGYYPRSAIRIFNWLLYTYAVPAAALLGSSAVLHPLEAGRLRPGEQRFYGRLLPVGAILTALAGVVVVFVWINLAIADWFATGSRLTLSFGDTPAQRLTVSIAWAIYALVLLAVGMSRSVQGLRWLSLGFLLVTIGKVFLYDLGALQDLYRVASLVGLAVSLILVSLLYQRFVFGEREKGSPGA